MSVCACPRVDILAAIHRPDIEPLADLAWLADPSSVSYWPRVQRA